MIKGKMKGLFINYIKKMKSLNYQVKCKLMNAKYYNVPQSRQRVIFIGVRKDLGIEPSYPEGDKKLITVREALVNVKNKTYTRRLATVASNIWDKIKPGQNGTYYRKDYYMNTVKVNPDKPCPTIPKTIGGTGATLHWKEKRSLTIEEVKRLSSFPDNYKTIGSPVQQWARIGNSVPPLFMKAIAEHIRINILEKAVITNG